MFSYWGHSMWSSLFKTAVKSYALPLFNFSQNGDDPHVCTLSKWQQTMCYLPEQFQLGITGFKLTFC